MAEQRSDFPSSSLDRATTWAVLVAATLLVLLTVWRGLVLAGVIPPAVGPTPPPPLRAASYQPGDVMDALPGLDVRAAPATLVLFLRSTCGVCTSSMEFYRRLQAAPRRAALVVAGIESVEVLEKYVSGHRFAPERIVQVSPGSVRVRGTPTAVLVDSEGVVQSVWLGKIAEAREAEVLAAVR
jgi:hypothetical protein